MGSTEGRCLGTHHVHRDADAPLFAASAPVVIFWTRVDRPPRADEVGQHQFGRHTSPAERQESSTTTSAGPAQTHSGSRGPLVVTASAIPPHSTHVMVRARVAAKPASRGPATAGVDGWECPLCRRFLSPTSRPVNRQHLDGSRARKGRSCARNLPTPQRSTTTTPTFLLRSSWSNTQAPTAGRASSLGRESARAALDATWWCAAFAAIPPNMRKLARVVASLAASMLAEETGQQPVCSEPDASAASPRDGRRDAA